MMPAPTWKKRKWTLSAFCVGPLPEEYTPEYRRRASIVDIKPNGPPSEFQPSVPTKLKPPHTRAVRFQHPLPLPRSLGSPHPAILMRIAFFSDSFGLRKLRCVSRDMRALAERILFRRVAVCKAGVRVLPPPGGCGGTLGDGTWVDDEIFERRPSKTLKPETEHVQLTVKEPEECSHTLWAPEPVHYDDDDNDDDDPGADTASISSAAALAGSTSFAACVSAACATLCLPPASMTSFTVKPRYAAKLLRSASVVDILPEPDAALMRRMLHAPPPIERAHPGASGTLTSSTVIVFSRARDDVPPAFPRPALTTSAARTVITHLLDADGTEALEGLSCGLEHTVVLISPGEEDDKTYGSEEEDVATLADTSSGLSRILSPATTLAPTIRSPNTFRSNLPRRGSLLEDDADPHRLLESLAAHIARLLPASGSKWTIVGCEAWPCDWVASSSEWKCSGRGQEEMQGAVRALVEAKFARWADKASGERLRFISREEWWTEVGVEVYDAASHL